MKKSIIPARVNSSIKLSKIKVHFLARIDLFIDVVTENLVRIYGTSKGEVIASLNNSLAGATTSLVKCLPPCASKRCEQESFAMILLKGTYTSEQRKD